LRGNVDERPGAARLYDHTNAMPLELMGWTAPTERHRVPCVVVGDATEKEPSVIAVTTIGLDIGKRLFQVHGIDASGKIVVRSEPVTDRCQRHPACRAPGAGVVVATPAAVMKTSLLLPIFKPRCGTSAANLGPGGLPLS
jgi:hypothetical protein